MKFSPYSFSKIGTFSQCPYRFKLQYIDKIKIPFEINIALEKGKYIHSLIEQYIKNEVEAFLEFYAKIIEDFGILRKKYEKHP